jgi:DNA-binding response OmpR family regulator
MSDVHAGQGSGSIASTEVATHGTPISRGSAGPPMSVRILLYSDDSATRDAVRLGVGRRPAKDVEVGSWLEVATPAAAVSAADAGGFDLLILDGEAAPIGGLGLCKQLKSEVFDCPPVIVLTGRPQDAWLAAWSGADFAVPFPLDPVTLARSVAELARRSATTPSA